MAEVNECKVYVGNLPFSVGFADLKEVFSKFGEVTDALVISDKHSGRSKGFGFVTFANKENAEKAIEEMNGKDFQGREIVVSQAKPAEGKSEKEDKEKS